MTSSIALVLALAVSLPWTARAQCALEGHGRVDDVRPRGTSLRIGLDETVAVTLRGARAEVRGVAPIALEGHARARDVHATLAQPREVLGVLRLEPGTPLRVLRERGGRARVRVEAGGVRAHFEVPCGALGLGIARTADAREAEADGDRHVMPRERSLAVFATASGGRPVVLRSADGLPPLEVIGRRGRIHVRAALAPGVLLEGWVERTDVATEGPIRGLAGGSSSGGCGWGYAGERYRGPATVVAGAELVDEHGVVLARTIADVAADLAVTGVTSAVRRTDSDGAVLEEVTHHLTFHVERIDGLVPEPCAPLGFEVREAGVRLPAGRSVR